MSNFIGVILYFSPVDEIKWPLFSGGFSVSSCLSLNYILRIDPKFLEGLLCDGERSPGKSSTDFFFHRLVMENGSKIYSPLISNGLLLYPSFLILRGGNN